MKAIKSFEEKLRGLTGRLMMLIALLLVGSASIGSYARPAHCYAKYTDNRLTFYGYWKDELESGEYWLNEGDNLPDWYEIRDRILEVEFDESFELVSPTTGYKWFSFPNLRSISNIQYLNTSQMINMSGMFEECRALQSIDLSNFNTARVTDMSRMFDGCRALQSIDLSNFNTARVTDMSRMFYGCSALQSIDLSNFNTAQVTDMSWMFEDCDELQSLDLSNFNTAQVTNMSGMFYGCSALQSIDLSNFNTAQVTDMSGMFEDCRALQSIDLSNFNTENVTDMMWMFGGCRALQSLDLSNFNTGKVTNMYCMFNDCRALQSLDLSNFNTEQMTNMENMFRGCPNLQSLDLSNFNTVNVKYMSTMFYQCPALKTIYVGSNFTTDGVTNSQSMFKGCTSLVGYAACDGTNNIDKSNANYQTGYFTKKVGTLGTDVLGATGEDLTLTTDLTLSDNADLVLYEPVKSRAASYTRTVNSTWGTLCVPFALTQNEGNNWTYYRFKGIDHDKGCITLESCEEGEIPAGTPLLFKMKEGETLLNLSASDTPIAAEPVATNDQNVNLIGTFAKIGGNENEGLTATDYIISKDKFWVVSELTAKEGSKGVGMKPMRAYIHPTTAGQAQEAMLNIGNAEFTTAIEGIQAISNDANATYYDIQGRRINSLQKGLNIVKSGNNTYKIMIK